MTTLTGLVLDDLFTFHDTGAFHVETADRLLSIKRSFEDRELLQQCTIIPPVCAPLEWIKANHSLEYIERLKSACRNGETEIDTPDSAISSRSFEIAQFAAGSALAAADRIVSGDLKRAFVACRPPGHHAEADRSMGFCLFNNAAIAARYLLARHNLERILILDWDVHHGNGTQHAFEDSNRVFFCSLHGDPLNLYPGTGFEWERGSGAGAGFTLNVPLLPGSSDEIYRRKFSDLCLPAFKRFQPQFTIVSAGFDAHRLDPVGNLALEDETFGWLTSEITGLADCYCGGRVLSLLEGGYNLEALGRCAALHLAGLING